MNGEIRIEVGVPEDGLIRIPEEVLEKLRNNPGARACLLLTLETEAREFSEEEIARIARTQHLEPSHVLSLLGAEGIAKSFPSLYGRLKNL